MIHKMTNRRLGVEHLITQFEVKGTPTLPHPESVAPGPEDSINGIQEYRPPYLPDINTPEVRDFLDVVIEDILAAWTEGDLSYTEGDLSRDTVSVSSCARAVPENRGTDFV